MVKVFGLGRSLNPIPIPMANVYVNPKPRSKKPKVQQVRGLPLLNKEDYPPMPKVKSPRRDNA